ncbi:hypothetical protein K1719_018722 [Acacia pycnantha]|nr:hypothetical protein K1719_018722 [Acacia pycnantha]
MSDVSKSSFDELRWVIQIRRTIEELEDDGELPVSIFMFPSSSWYKLAAAKRFQKQLESLKLENLIQQLTKLEQRIRACYHKFLDFNDKNVGMDDGG